MQSPRKVHCLYNSISLRHISNYRAFHWRKRLAIVVSGGSNRRSHDFGVFWKRDVLDLAQVAMRLRSSRAVETFLTYASPSIHRGNSFRKFSWCMDSRRYLRLVQGLFLCGKAASSTLQPLISRLQPPPTKGPSFPMTAVSP